MDALGLPEDDRRQRFLENTYEKLSALNFPGCSEFLESKFTTS